MDAKDAKRMAEFNRKNPDVSEEIKDANKLINDAVKIGCEATTMRFTFPTVNHELKFIHYFMEYGFVIQRQDDNFYRISWE